MTTETIAPSLSDLRLKALKRSGLLERSEGDRFDRLAEHIRVVVGSHTAIISLIDHDRQVFVGQCGLPEEWSGKGETPLSHSFCKHVVERNAPMIVFDARNDPSLRENLAIEDIGIVAYLGTPLRLPTGEVVGAVAAVEREPREWTQADLRRLQSVASIVEAEIVVRLSEIKWRTLFEDMQEGFFVGEAVRDEDGLLVDFRFMDVNPAFERLTGIVAADVNGRTLLDTLPDAEQELLAHADRVLRSGVPEVFVIRSSSVTSEWFELRMRRLIDDRFAVVFSNVTARKAGEQELAEMEQRRRIAADVGEVGVFDLDLETERLVWDDRVKKAFGLSIDKEPDQASKLAAVHPSDRTEFDRRFAKALVTGDFDMQFRAIGIDDQRERWVSVKGRIIDDGNRPARMIGAVRDVSDRIRSEQSQAVLNGELAHRLKNTLAVVQSIATQTLRTAPDLTTARQSLTSRIQTLASAHDILLAGQRDAGSVESIIRGAISLHDPDGRIRLRGPLLEIGPKAALTLALIMHEMSTNAAKYGALSVPDGKVHVAWVVEVDTETKLPTLALGWTEIDGPPALTPTRKGFGTRLIEMGLSGSTGGQVDLDYAPDGLKCRIVAPLVELQVDQ